MIYISHFILNSTFSKVFSKVPKKVVIPELPLLSVNVGSALISVKDLLLPKLILLFTILFTLDVIIKSSAMPFTDVKIKNVDVIYNLCI